MDPFEQTRALYRAAYTRHGKSPAALLIPKGRQRERFTALAAPIPSTGFSVLDFGCGFGDLFAFLEGRCSGFRYLGVDIVPEFVEECRRNHPARAEFRLIDGYAELMDEVDFVLASGTFNTLYAETAEAHWVLVQQILVHLFRLCRRALCVDFMTNRVDFEQPRAYHQDPVTLFEFAFANLSRRLVLDQSYLPYEFALIAYKDAGIVRPENVYRDLHADRAP